MVDDKFILTSLDDENSKAVAEVLGNKTCKKIINYLGDRREASEQEISNDLGIPMNTAEYNLKKLIKAGFVRKTKNFFWSVKGRKIAMYKLARKHVVISPARGPNLKALKSILPVLAIMALVVMVALIAEYSDNPVIVEEGQLNQFSSQLEMNEFIKENADVQSGGFFGGLFRGGIMMAETAAAGALEKSSDSGASDFSTTNIQVEGVDEADIVKNDGKYIYVVSGGKVLIVDAYPAEDMKILSEIELENVGEIYINDDKLIVFANSYSGRYCGPERCYGMGSVNTGVYIYDISDKENPVLDNEIEAEGNYIESRMIGDYVYVINSKYFDNNRPEPPVYIINGVAETVVAEDVYYWNFPDSNYVFTSIMAIDVDDGDFNSEVFLTGQAWNIYVSEDNIYLSYTKWVDPADYVDEMVDVYRGILPLRYRSELNEIKDSDDAYYEKMNKISEIVEDYSSSLRGNNRAEFDKDLMEALEGFEIEMAKKREKTIVHKINVDELNIEYKAVGDVPGHVLNQFSMDEYDGNFRIATTTGQVSRTGSGSLNHLYVLNEDLEIIGSVEDLADGESIYSTRFMGKRAYIVTFKKIDPLFVIDLEDPENPEVLGYLKITGYSDYLHPYDENHVIGIGKETAGGGEQFSWYQGVKVSLFDVSDVENPVEVGKIEIGDRGTDSEALREHKAVLFDREKGILVIPISLHEIDKGEYDGEIPDNAYGKMVWEGVYVLDIGLDGISEKGKITHNGEIEVNEYGYKNFPYGTQIRRSLYLDDVLYTISLGNVKANALDDLSDISSVDLGYEEEVRYEVAF